LLLFPQGKPKQDEGRVQLNSVPDIYRYWPLACAPEEVVAEPFPCTSCSTGIGSSHDALLTAGS